MVCPTSGQYNSIPSNIGAYEHLAIVSARSDVCGASNSTWSVMFIESTCMQYGQCEGDLTGITLNTGLYSAIGSQLEFLQPTDPGPDNLRRIVRGPAPPHGTGPG